jgi:hypothetical protein
MSLNRVWIHVSGQDSHRVEYNGMRATAGPDGEGRFYWTAYDLTTKTDDHRSGASPTLQGAQEAAESALDAFLAKRPTR